MSEEIRKAIQAIVREIASKAAKDAAKAALNGEI
jgi:hypothetical protein